MDHVKEWIVWLRKMPPERYVLLVLLLLTGIFWYWVWAIQPRPLEVISFAVGKGDAFLIRSPSGRTLLIDGGSSDIPDVGTRQLVPNLMLLGVRKLDAIIMTHPDSDHINALPAVLEAIPVGMLLDPELPGGEGTDYQQLLYTAAQHGVAHQRLRAGATIDLGSQVRLHVLYPGETLLTGTVSDTNNNCIVCKLEYRRASMLFTGDLETEGEAAVLAQGDDLHADVLKVAHHGSKNGTSAAFLTAAHPSLAVISCPSGEQGDHPHVDVLARLRAQQIQILRTDVCGQIHLSSYGNGWQITTYRQAAGR